MLCHVAVGGGRCASGGVLCRPPSLLCEAAVFSGPQGSELFPRGLGALPYPTSRWQLCLLSVCICPLGLESKSHLSSLVCRKVTYIWMLTSCPVALL